MADVYFCHRIHTSFTGSCQEKQWTRHQKRTRRRPSKEPDALRTKSERQDTKNLKVTVAGKQRPSKDKQPFSRSSLIKNSLINTKDVGILKRLPPGWKSSRPLCVRPLSSGSFQYEWTWARNNRGKTLKTEEKKNLKRKKLGLVYLDQDLPEG